MSREDWPTKKLGEVCSKSTGVAYKSSDFTEESSGSVPVILLRDFDHPFYTEKYLTNLDRYSNHVWVETGDILISKTSDIKLCVWKGPKSVLNQNAMRLRVNKSEIEKNLVLYFLRIKINELRGLLVGGTIRFVKEGEIMGLEVPIPPPQTQRAIVKRLDAIRKAQELNEKQISLADELLNSLIQGEILEGPWEEIELREVVRNQEFTNPKKKPRVRFNYIEISCIHPETKRIMKFREILGEKAPSRARKVVRDGDTVWSTVRPYLENIAHVIHLPDPKVASTGFCVLSPKSSVIDHNWLYYNVSSNWFIKKILPFQKGASYPAVSDGNILSQTIKFALIKEQKKIVKKLTAVQEYKNRLLKQKKLLQELFESTLNKAMKGELVK